MSFILRKGTPLDREDECNYIADRINSLISNLVFIIWADSGIGKTALIKKIKYINKLNFNIVSITTPPVNQNNLILSGQYISYIALSLDEEYKDTFFSMQSFLLMGKESRTNSKNRKEILSNLKSIPQKVVLTYMDSILSTGNYDTNYILNGTDTDSVLINIAYIKYVLSNNNIVLNISNIQNIDMISLLELKKIIEKLPCRGYIFEYTTISENITNLFRMADDFNEVSEVELMKLDKLPLQIIQPILQDNTKITFQELEYYYLETARGNLFKLQNYVNNKEQGLSPDIYKDSTQIIIENLSLNAQFILRIIELHDGTIEKALFFDILALAQQRLYIDFHNCKKELTPVIAEDKKIFTIQHASVRDSSKKMKRQVIMFAGDLVQKYYQGIIDNRNYILISQKQALLYLFKVYSIYNPIKILSYLDDFRLLLVASVDKSQAYEIILQVFDSLPADTGKEIKFKLITLAYEIGLYNEALALLEKTNYIDISFGLCHCMILNRLDLHHECLELCDNLIKYSCDVNSRGEFIAKLIEILSLRSLNQMKEYKKITNDILSNQTYLQYLEYGFFLRNMQISVSYKKSLKFIKDSIFMFERQQRQEYSLYSKLTLCVQLARLGYVDNSMRLLVKIEPSILKLTLEKHVILNNKAVILMLDNNSQFSVDVELQKAYFTATSVFDRIVILNNRICNMIRQNTCDNFDEVSNELLKLVSCEPDTRQHRRTYINIALYYNFVLQDISSFKQYINMAKTIESAGDVIGDYFTNNIEPPKEFQFIAKHNYYVSFITYWHFPIPMI